MTFQVSPDRTRLRFEHARTGSFAEFRALDRQEALLEYWEDVLGPMMARAELEKEYTLVREIGKGVSGVVNLYEGPEGAVAIKEMPYYNL